MDNRIVIHIGYHKCASTTLQRSFFPHLDAAVCPVAGPQRAMLDLIESRDAFSSSVFRDWIGKQAGCAGSRPLILTHEELSGHVCGHAHIDPHVTARNLKAALPDASILIIIRNQFDYIRSVYTFRVAGKGTETRSLHEFVMQEGEKGLFAHVEYHELIGTYIDLFGREKVHVLPMERLGTDEAGFLNDIADIAGVPRVSLSLKRENTSTHVLGVVSFWRPFNRMFRGVLAALRLLTGKKDPQTGYHSFRRLRYSYYAAKKTATRRLNTLFRNSPGIDLRHSLSDGAYRRLYDRFALSNAALQDMLGIDLAKYHYPLPQAQVSPRTRARQSNQ